MRINGAGVKQIDMYDCSAFEKQAFPAYQSYISAYLNDKQIDMYDCSAFEKQAFQRINHTYLLI